ncbi:MAG: hypothetical protein M3170_03835 [Candidatus Dormibacteraeota bacterium]|nr:hypothetical protein [Candidatus Dormibacteraeota bacterium]
MGALLAEAAAAPLAWTAPVARAQLEAGGLRAIGSAEGGPLRIPMRHFWIRVLRPE